MMQALVLYDQRTDAQVIRETEIVEQARGLVLLAAETEHQNGRASCRERVYDDV